MKSLQENLKLQPVLKWTQIEVATSSRGHDMELNWESQQRDLKLQLQEMENRKSKLQPLVIQGSQGRSRPITEVAT